MKKITFTFLCSLALSLSACGGNTNQGTSTSIYPMPPAAPASSSQSFAGPRANYAVRNTANGFVVTEISTSKITSIPSNITSLSFSDSTVNLQIAKKVSSISATDLQKLEELYVAFFNRVPDANGLSYWIDQLAAGATINQIAENFYRAALLFPKETGYSSTMSTADFIKIIYKNVLGRTSVDQGGLDYWTNSLDTGKESRSSLVATILYSAHTFKGDATYGNVADLLDNKVAIANYFAVQQGMGYLTDADSITIGTKIAAAVTNYEFVNAKKLILVGNDASTDIFSAPLILTPDVAQLLKNAQACPDGMSSDTNSSTCVKGAALGTSTFGNTVCNLSVTDDGTISLVVGANAYKLKKPYNVNYLKSTPIASTPAAYILTFIATDYGSTTGQMMTISLKSPGMKAYSQIPSLTAEVKFISDFSKNASCTFPLAN